MNIELFIKSLTDNERQELVDNLLGTKPETQKLMTIREFLNKHIDTISVRLFNNLKYSCINTDTPVFSFVKDINKKQYLKLRRSGKVTWAELEEMVKNCSIYV